MNLNHFRGADGRMCSIIKLVNHYDGDITKFDTSKLLTPIGYY